MADKLTKKTFKAEEFAFVLTQVIFFAMNSAYEIPVPLRFNFAIRQMNWNLMLVNKKVHALAHEAFFALNTFFVTQTGSVVDQRGLRALTCGICTAHCDLKFETGLVHLGHDRNADVAFATINNTINFFKTPTEPLTFKHLTIDVKYFYFRTETQIQQFIQSLSNVKVANRLTITGLDIHVQGWMRHVAAALMMRFEPVDFEMEMRDAESGEFEPFRVEYVPATSRADMTRGIQMAGNLIDPLMMLNQYMAMADSLDDHRYDFSAQIVLRR